MQLQKVFKELSICNVQNKPCFAWGYCFIRRLRPALLAVTDSKTTHVIAMSRAKKQSPIQTIIHTGRGGIK